MSCSHTPEVPRRVLLTPETQQMFFVPQDYIKTLHLCVCRQTGLSRFSQPPNPVVYLLRYTVILPAWALWPFGFVTPDLVYFLKINFDGNIGLPKKFIQVFFFVTLYGNLNDLFGQLNKSPTNITYTLFTINVDDIRFTLKCHSSWMWSVRADSLQPLMDCSPSDSSIHGIFQVGILKWVPFLLQGTFPNQGLNLRSLCLLHWQADSLHEV